MLKSSSYYRQIHKKINSAFPVFCAAFFLGGLGIGMGLLYSNIKDVEKVMQPTGYYEYVEENTAIDKEKYLDLIGDEKTKALLKQTKSEWTRCFYFLPYCAGLSAIYFGALHYTKRCATRAEKIELMRAETDRIKVNYDPKYADDDYDIKYDLN